MSIGVELPMTRDLKRAANDLALAERLVKKTHTGYPDIDSELHKVAARIRRIERSLRSGFEDPPPNRPVLFDADGYPR